MYDPFRQEIEVLWYCGIIVDGSSRHVVPDQGFNISAHEWDVIMRRRFKMKEVRR